MFERLKFWWTFKNTYKFLYDKETGNGFAPTMHSPFTDHVWVRTSSRGYVDGYDYNGRPISRKVFVDFYADHKEWEQP